MSRSEDVECLVPGAGRSQRMGTWKPAIAFGESTIIQTVVSRSLQVCAGVVLVTGYRGAELALLFRDAPRVRLVENPDWPRGMFSSIRRGVEHVRAAKFFVMLGDMPWTPPEVYRALLQYAAADFVFPVFDGRRGHPVLCTARVKEEVLRADPAAGSMKEIASRLTVQELPWKDDSIHRDIDTAEDLV
ncbi:MAG TPA: NTP transferase domain-containing protein [Spirochaetia bacterium]|nr:NTP transferase domain-containing protein [Spirochaetia bacterium]